MAWRRATIPEDSPDERIVEAAAGSALMLVSRSNLGGKGAGFC